MLLAFINMISLSPPSSSFLIPTNPRMPKILHPHPGRRNPDPSHHRRQNNQRRIIPRYRQRGIILQLRRRVRRLAYIPGPAPYFETGPYSDDEDEPGGDQDDVAPEGGGGVVPGVVWGGG